MKKIVVISIILAILVIIIFIKFKHNEIVDPRGSLYAGSISCVKCHSDIYHSYLHTAHYMASGPAANNTVHGNFSNNFNVFTVSRSQKIVMEKGDSDMFQNYYLNGKSKERHRFDIALGGVKGESYLYWKDNGLNQLPVSYYTKSDKWLMSPGFAPGFSDFNRIITSRCMECHASYIADKPNEANIFSGAEQFDKNSLVFAVDCERCHGPGAKHADFQSDNQKLKTPRFIISYKSLPRQARIDMCGVCHSGNKSQMIRSTFFFTPGDTLSKYKLPDFYRSATPNNNLDVHGNQVQLLESSKCFINSKMDCATCHDTHKNQRGNALMYTQKCIGCHSTENHNYCKMATMVNAQFLKSNCIKCHMPGFASGVIVTANKDSTTNTGIYVHTHHISIYPKQTKQILAMVGK